MNQVTHFITLTGTSEEEQNSPDIADQDDSVELQNYEPEDPPVCDNEPEKRDPKWSMRPQNAFFWFCNEEHSKVKASHPDFSVIKIARELAKRWKEADPEAKAKFERIAEYDRKRYGQVNYKETKVVKKRKKVDDDNDFHGVAGTSTCNR
ncbi:high mobility group protein DSP1-like [Helicoverpa zea]|uniref:high mobility group protein DSP1-like n=1 Tax=Helicoverpa zea TaxID=7113 RepID=UPI001F58E8F7|nr:high mobility group protein DSP1-like [Helicoverpa zea]